MSLGAEAFDINRAMQNYQAVTSGTKRIQDLSPEEKSEVLAVFQANRNSCDDDDTDCCDAIDDADSSSDDLESSAQSLATCASNDDYSDDCWSEFTSVQSAHSDYESAVSDVDSNCDDY